MSKNREEFMTQDQQRKLDDKPHTHENCKIFTGVMRPGKTAKDRALRHNRQQ